MSALAFYDERGRRYAPLAATRVSARAAGFFDAPSFVVDGDAYWGDDRPPPLERRLKKEPRP